MHHHSCAQQSLVLPSTSELVCSSRFRFAWGGGGARRFSLLKVDSADDLCTKRCRAQNMWTVSAVVTAAAGAGNVPTNLRRSEVTGAEVGGDALRRGHGRRGSASLLQHVGGGAGTGSGVYTGGHLFGKRRRNRGA